MPHHRQTHSFTIYKGQALEGGIYILLNKHRVSLKQQESPISLCGFIVRPKDHRKLKQGIILWGCPRFFFVDLARNINDQLSDTVSFVYHLQMIHQNSVPVYNTRKKVWNIANARCQTLKSHQSLNKITMSWFKKWFSQLTNNQIQTPFLKSYSVCLKSGC